MLSDSELAEMLDIRRRIDELQMRYNELTAKMAAPPAGAGPFAAQPPARASVPLAPQPVYQQPVMPVAQYAQPLMAQPVMVQPPLAVRPAQPAQPPMSASQSPQDSLETKRLPPRPSPAPAAPKDRASMTLKDHVVAVLSAADTALPFEEIYKRVEENGAPLPKEKPKLVVRQVLYNKALFQVMRGAFSLVPNLGAPPPRRLRRRRIPSSPIRRRGICSSTGLMPCSGRTRSKRSALAASVDRHDAVQRTVDVRHPFLTLGVHAPRAIDHQLVFVLALGKQKARAISPVFAARVHSDLIRVPVVERAGDKDLRPRLALKLEIHPFPCCC